MFVNYLNQAFPIVPITTEHCARNSLIRHNNCYNDPREKYSIGKRFYGMKTINSLMRHIRKRTKNCLKDRKILVRYQEEIGCMAFNAGFSFFFFQHYFFHISAVTEPIHSLIAFLFTSTFIILFLSVWLLFPHSHRRNNGQR